MSVLNLSGRTHSGSYDRRNVTPNSNSLPQTRETINRHQRVTLPRKHGMCSAWVHKPCVPLTACPPVLFLVLENQKNNARAGKPPVAPVCSPILEHPRWIIYRVRYRAQVKKFAVWPLLISSACGRNNADKLSGVW